MVQSILQYLIALSQLLLGKWNLCQIILTLVRVVLRTVHYLVE